MAFTSVVRKGYAEQQPLPDGSFSDGWLGCCGRGSVLLAAPRKKRPRPAETAPRLVVFCSPQGVLGYCPVPSAADAQKSLALGDLGRSGLVAGGAGA